MELGGSSQAQIDGSPRTRGAEATLLAKQRGPLPLSARLRAFALIAAELVLVLLFVHRFEIGPDNFFAMLCLAVGGFAIHAWLPRGFQTAFFVLLSLAGILLVLGWANGSALIGIGLAFIAVCHLPIPVPLRAVILVLAGAAMAGLRVDYPAPSFWPVLASMFMFRLIVYLFELRHGRNRAPWMLTLAYFFPLPNVCFVLFPVLDFQTFRATYYDEEDYTIYQTGVRWIMRGLSHLVAYRFVKYYLLPMPYQMHDVGHIALFLAANYALYLRVSGWYHIITGLLHLFGFNLPRTHQNYFLASSPSDIWRRINIYWKDFMTKVFFFPAYFRLRRFGERAATAGATLAVFIATWLLHSYQLFCLVGDLTLSFREAGLWLGAGLLVTFGLQFDLGHAEEVTGEPPRGRNWRRAIAHSWKVVGTFTLVSLFWACWTDPSFFSRLQISGSAIQNVAEAVALLVGIAVALAAAGLLVPWVRDRWRRLEGFGRVDCFTAFVGVQIVALMLLLLASVPQVAGALGSSAQELAATLRHETPTLLEAGQLVQGYYEEIAATHVQAGPFLGRLKLGDQAPPDWGRYADATRPTDDPLLGHELIPGWKGKLAFAPATINHLGMRDREAISVRKPPHTYRIALVGSSVIMGVGVEDGEVFKCLLEDRLNGAAMPGRPRFELLNFGMGRSMAINRVRLIERKVFGFEPDAIFYFAHQDELYSAGQFMAGIVYMKIPLPYPYMAEVIRKAGVTADTPAEALEGRFMPFAREVTLGLYRALVEECRQRGIVPVWIYLPMPGIQQAPADAEAVVSVAEQAGFQVINLADWAQGHAPAEVKLGADDHHPNALGHRLIAERLFAEWKKHPALLPASGR